MEVLIILKNKYMKISLLIVILLITIIIYPKIVISYLDLSQRNNMDNEIILEPSEASNVEKLLIAIESTIIHDQTIKDASYLAIDVESINLSINEKQSLVNYFKKYNEIVILKSIGDLKRLGVLDYFFHDIYRGKVISVEEITEISDEKVEILVSKHSGPLGGTGYKVTLELKNGKWQLTTPPDMLWIS